MKLNLNLSEAESCHRRVINNNPIHSIISFPWSNRNAFSLSFSAISSVHLSRTGCHTPTLPPLPSNRDAAPETESGTFRVVSSSIWWRLTDFDLSLSFSSSSRAEEKAKSQGAFEIWELSAVYVYHTETCHFRSCFPHFPLFAFFPFKLPMTWMQAQKLNFMKTCQPAEFVTNFFSWTDVEPNFKVSKTRSLKANFLLLALVHFLWVLPLTT